MSPWVSFLLITLTDTEHIWYIDIGSSVSSLFTGRKPCRLCICRIYSLLPHEFLAFLASQFLLLMKHACSLTLRTGGNEKWMKSFWNNVFDYHNTSTIQGLWLSCIVACNKKAMLCTKVTCTHVLQRMKIFALFSSLSIDIEVLFLPRVSMFEQPKWFLFFISLCRSSF